ncbi:calcium/sodium antiporter [Histidinibacterium aquaticum]|uniref:Calcium/sodium antiporter n=1 Tax=Histidinibacterium aquaticum TaxID=2613962 RepID=A0A5J5GMR0_9RHOB|nr:calcium/sodium antiporter [Histidinibacterium aquaticum]KAA9008772.1 calcium/sodium antiporter [Histidinibacterium aquaticum]
MLDVWVPLFGGLALLILGGDLLVRGAVKVAETLGVSPLVIGLTLVGFGTSTPELVTSVQAALTDAPGIAYGNIVGSNIANILLILGFSAILFPIVVSSSALRRDAVFMLGVAAAFAALSFLVPMGRVVGLLFIASLGAYIYVAFRQESRSSEHGAVYDKAAALEAVDPAVAPKTERSGGLLLPLLLSLGGLVLVVLGGRFLVDGAISIAESFGIPETVIGLTIVAVGTSMPELVTSVLAAVKRQSDVAFGNIVGSNIYNILGIGGATALISPTRVPQEIVTFDNLIMVGVSLLLVVFAATSLRIARGEGAVLVAGYLAYLYVLWP